MYNGSFSTDGYSICFTFTTVIPLPTSVPPSISVPLPTSVPPSITVPPPPKFIFSKKKPVDTPVKDGKKAKKDPSSAELAAIALQEKVKNMGIVEEYTLVAAIDPGVNAPITAVYGTGVDAYQVRTISKEELYHNSGQHRMTQRRYVYCPSMHHSHSNFLISLLCCKI